MLLVFIFDMTGYLMVFKFHQSHIRKQIKQQIKNGISEDELQLFSISHKEYNQLEWVREDIEFRIGANMFDIVRNERTADSVYLQCVNDKEEELLFAQLDEMIRKKMEQESSASQNPSRQWGKLYKLFSCVIPQNKSQCSCEEFVPDLFNETSFLYLSPYLEISSPPPDPV